MHPSRRWVVDEDNTIWFEVEHGGSLEPWEALEPECNNEYFEDAYDDLIYLLSQQNRRVGPVKVPEGYPVTSLKWDLNDRDS